MTHDAIIKALRNEESYVRHCGGDDSWVGELVSESLARIADQIEADDGEPAKSPDELLDERVLQWLRDNPSWRSDNPGQSRALAICGDLGVASEQVLDAMDSLEHAGKIRFDEEGLRVIDEVATVADTDDDNEPLCAKWLRDRMWDKGTSEWYVTLSSDDALHFFPMNGQWVIRLGASHAAIAGPKTRGEFRALVRMLGGELG